MKKLISHLVFAVLLLTLNPVAAAPVFSFSPTPLTSTADTVLTIKSGWRERITIGPGDPGYAANVVVNGNIVNLDVVGGNGQIFFPDIFTHVVNLGKFSPGAHQLRLRFRDLPTELGIPGFLNPGVAATANFIVEPGPVLVTQVPAMAASGSIMLSLMVLGLGMFAVQRR
jgi:hypothetical protein